MTEDRGQPTIIVEKGPNSFQSCMGCVGYGILGLFALYALGSLTRCDEKKEEPVVAESTPATKADDVCTATGLTEVPVRDIEAAYAANEAAAQLQYGKGCQLISGTIEDVTLDISDDPIIKLAGESGPTVYLIDEAASQAATLAKGEKVRFVCAQVSEFLGSPSLKDCYVAPETEPATP